MNSVISQLKQQNKDLKEKEIEGLLFLLKNRSLSNNELLQITGLPKETLKQFKNSINNYLEELPDLVKLNDQGIDLLKDSEFSPYKWSLLSYEDEELLAQFVKILEELKITPERKYDQWFATPETTVAKMKVMLDKGMLEGKSIALLGDDDLLSIVLMLSRVKFAKLSVFDIDGRIIKIVSSFSKTLNLNNVYTHELNFKDEIPSSELNQYDVVVTDPPYTINGVGLFLKRALEVLKIKNDFSSGYIFLYYGNSYKSPEKFLQVQKLISEQGLVIEDKINKFAKYNGAESIGSTSSLYVLKTSPATTLNIDLSFNNIYTYDEKGGNQFPYVEHYVCKLFKVPSSVLDSKKFLLKAAGEFCKVHGLNVVKTDIFKFQPYGFSLTMLLSNSNLNIHTWNEYNAIHIDLVTCSKLKNSEMLVSSLEKLFLSPDVEVKKVE